jgi:hypothetical protein
MANRINGVYSLDQTERRILQALRDKGPGMLMEVAVRTLDFPERVAPVLRALHEQGLVQVDRIRGGVLDNELWSITPLGRRALEESARSPEQQLAPAARMARNVAPPPNSSNSGEYQSGVDASSVARSLPPCQPTRQELEIDLLMKLGDLAAQRGDTNEAIERYQQALKLVREKGGSPDA